MFNDYNKISVEYSEINNVEISGNDTYLTVFIDNIPFEFLIHRRNEAENAIVFGSGAYNAEKMSPPIFNRHKWKNDFENGTTIYYNDPTLYLGEINLAWGYGNKKRHFLKEISNIISILLRKLHIENKNTLFVGSSGGGFTSLMLAGMFKGSKAFVNNPQTNITMYYKKAVTNLYKTVYKANPDTNFSNFEPSRTNVAKMYKKLKYIPEIYYAQNLAVQHDVNNHALPFIEEVSSISNEVIGNKITMHYYNDKEKGHNPLSKEETVSIINSILNNKQ